MPHGDKGLVMSCSHECGPWVVHRRDGLLADQTKVHGFSNHGVVQCNAVQLSASHRHFDGHHCGRHRCVKSDIRRRHDSFLLVGRPPNISYPNGEIIVLHGVAEPFIPVLDSMGILNHKPYSLHASRCFLFDTPTSHIASWASQSAWSLASSPRLPRQTTLCGRQPVLFCHHATASSLLYNHIAT